MDTKNVDEPCYRFTPKHRWHVKLHFMSGITLLPWLHLLRTYWHEIDWRVYWHRVLFLSFMSVVNSLLALMDWLWYNRQTAGQQLNAEPVFILGHPRSGTTHVHNLLSLDPAFAYATTFHAGFPSSFISLEQLGLKPLLSPLLEPTRPMDAMKLHWDLPAEDEIAVSVLTGGVSFYTPLVFPRCEPALRRLLTLRTSPAAGAGGGARTSGGAGARSSDSKAAATAAAVGAASEEEVSAWRDAFLWFMKKVTLYHCLKDRNSGGSSSASNKANGPKPLLIKSPVHTPRLHHWLSLFPQARFVYIHRHPLDVFRSTAHMADTYFWYTCLQSPTDRGTTDYILDQYDIMYEEYVSQRHLVPPGQLVEVPFADLDAHPLDTLRTIYATFGWSDRFESLLPRFTAYCNSLGDFKKNQLSRLDPALEARIRDRWEPSFKEFGYA